MPISPNAQAAMNGGEEEKQQAKMQDLLTQWIRASYGIAALSPQSIRSELTQAQQGFSGMINSTLQQQREPALKARRQWEQSSMAALQANKQRLGAYGEIWGNQGMNIEDKMAALRETAMKLEDQPVAQMTASPQHFSTFGKYLDMLAQSQQTAEQVTQQLDTQIKSIESRLPPAWGMPKGGGQVPPITPYLGEGEDSPPGLQ